MLRSLATLTVRRQTQMALSPQNIAVVNELPQNGATCRQKQLIIGTRNNNQRIWRRRFDLNKCTRRWKRNMWLCVWAEKTKGKHYDWKELKPTFFPPLLSEAFTKIPWNQILRRRELPIPERTEGRKGPEIDASR